MILHKATRGGDAGRRNLQRRITLFDAGSWDILLFNAAASMRRSTQRSRDLSEDQLLAKQLAKALHLAEQGELSHAARELRSSGLAPGNRDTLEELRDPNLRPTQPSEPLPEGLDTFVPACPIELDKQIFAEVLRSSRRGLSAAVTGNRNEYLKLCLEDGIAFNLLHQAASRLARAQVPEPIIG